MNTSNLICREEPFDPDNHPTSFGQASRAYCDQFPFRVAIQLLPGVGSAIDTLLAGQGLEWQYKRLEYFIAQLKTRLDFLEGRGQLREITPNEPFYDFTRHTFEKIIGTASRDKIRLFANIFQRQMQSTDGWQDAEVAVRLLDELTETHIRILQITEKAPICGGSFEGIRAVHLRRDDPGNDFSGGPLDLESAIPGVKRIALMMFCSELVARGLLHDEGNGRIEVKAMEFFTSTELTRWFIGWICEQDGTMKISEQESGHVCK